MRQRDSGRTDQGQRGISGRLFGRLGRRTATPGRPTEPAREADTPTTGHPATAPRTVRDDFPHRYLLRSSATPDSPVAELVRDLPADPRRPVVVVDVPPAAAANLGEELGALLARLRDEAPLAVRLVLSGSAAPAGEDGPLAQRLADAWAVTVEAPDAPAVLTPGGLLHVPEPATPGGGWWRFAPGTAPEPLGARLPSPHWQRALTRVPLGPLGESVVRAVPAGLLLSPAGSAAPRPDDPAYAVAAHPRQLSVLLGAPRAVPVTAEDVATLLAGLPAEPRRTARLVPADGRDAVGLAEEVCDLLGTELEVTLGLPLSTAPEQEYEAGGDADSVHPDCRLVSPEGEFTWPPLLTAVVCSPADADGSRPAPRPVSWTLPETAGTPGTEPASLRLPSGAWAVAVRSGLWLGSGPVPPAAVRDRAAEARALRVELSPDLLDGAAARDSHLKDLAALLATLDETARAHAELALPEGVRQEDAAELRRFAVRASLSLAPALAPQHVSTEAVPAPAPAPEERGAEVDSRQEGEVREEAQEADAEPELTAEAEAQAEPEPQPEPEPPSAPDPEPEPERAQEPDPDPTPEPEPNAAPEPKPTPEPNPTPEPTPEPKPVPAPTPEPSAPSPATPTAIATATATAPAQPLTLVRPLNPVSPAGPATDQDRRAFRELAAGVWEEHSEPVAQALIRLPALRGAGEAAARADLIAVHLYLTSAPEDPFGARALAAGTEELRAYAACLASGLQRLPALRGTLVRAVPESAVPDAPVPGTVLDCDAPLDVVHLEAQEAPLPPPEHVRYVIRPLTARRTSVLSRSRDGSGAQALFAAGTAFAVLARHDAQDGLPARVLLAELPAGGGRFREPSAEAVARLDAAAQQRSGPSSTPWPDRCTGPFRHISPTP